MPELIHVAKSPVGQDTCAGTRFTARGAAKYLDMAVSTWNFYVGHRRAPQPDGYFVYGKRRHPFWYMGTLDYWDGERPLRHYLRTGKHPQHRHRLSQCPNLQKVQ